MIGERLAELRKLNGETQEDLAKAFHVSVPTVRTWERDKASPSHEVLIALCEEEQNEMHRYEEYLLWKRKK